MSNQEIKDTIIGWIGPTSLCGTPPLEKFISLGVDAIPVVIDIFRNPRDIREVREYGDDVYLPVLVELLNYYAVAHVQTARHALFEIANQRVLTWGKYGREAQELAYKLAQLRTKDKIGFWRRIAGL